ncbi:hypothetical protein AVEN_186667-1, partial [Araneus ventricosus]
MFFQPISKRFFRSFGIRSLLGASRNSICKSDKQIICYSQAQIEARWTVVKMKVLVVLVMVLVAVSARSRPFKHIHPLSQKMIEYVNFMNTTWK